MKKIEIIELLDKLNNYENSEINLLFEGIISMEVEFSFSRILNEKEYLTFYDIYNKKISIKKHQIMKIELITNDEILVRFDGLQTLKLTLSKKKM